MAAPHVAGVNALLLEADPNLSPSKAKEILLNTAEDKGESGWDPSYGWGEIDAYKAITLATNQHPVIIEPLPSNPIGVPSISEIFGNISQQPSLLDGKASYSLIEIARVLFYEFLITGYYIMMPWGFILIAASIVTVTVHGIIKRYNR